MVNSNQKPIKRFNTSNLNIGGSNIRGTTSNTNNTMPSSLVEQRASNQQITEMDTTSTVINKERIASELHELGLTESQAKNAADRATTTTDGKIAITYYDGAMTCLYDVDKDGKMKIISGEAYAKDIEGTGKYNLDSEGFILDDSGNRILLYKGANDGTDSVEIKNEFDKETGKITNTRIYKNNVLIQEEPQNVENENVTENQAAEEQQSNDRQVRGNDNAEYYFNNLESPDSPDDFVVYVEPDPNYVSRAVEVTDQEKQWIISAIDHEQGGCKAGSIQTAQTIRDMYLYSSAINENARTIKDLLTTAFKASDVYSPNLNPSQNAIDAFEYVFEQGNSFYPRKFVAQNGFQIGGYANLGYYHVMAERGHIDNKAAGTKAYLGGSYPFAYNWGNSMLDTGGIYADYINPNAKLK